MRVIKADGLAAGKGVVIAEDRAAAAERFRGLVEGAAGWAGTVTLRGDFGVRLFDMDFRVWEERGSPDDHASGFQRNNLVCNVPGIDVRPCDLVGAGERRRLRLARKGAEKRAVTLLESGEEQARKRGGRDKQGDRDEAA